MEPIDLVELIPSGTSTGISSIQVVRTVEHLISSRSVAAIGNGNPNEDLKTSFVMTLSKDRSVIEGQDTTVRHEGLLKLQVGNRGKVTLHVVGLIMGSLRGIEDILNRPQGQHLRVMLPKKEQTDMRFGASGKQSVDITISIDEALTQTGKYKCKEILSRFL